MILAALLLAAIVTERNDLYNGVGCYTPPQYTFVGTPSRPGIESCWIPYGTYTSGTGSVEYLRVTGKLMGVVASALGGLAERSVQLGWGPRQCMLRPTVFPVPWGQSYHDYGSFLSSTTNLSYRIADQLNECATGVGLLYVEVDGTNYNYNFTSPLEERLLEVAKQYGSRRLEALVGSAEPPISSEWSPNLPYNVADSNLWRNVYPMLCFCTNDIYFLPEGYYRGRRLPDPNPNGWGSLEGLWGDDFGQSLSDLQSALAMMPLAVTIEDVLSYDTGWKYEPRRLTNDYWTVDGVRLRRATHSGEWDDLEHSHYADWSGYATQGNFLVVGWEMGGYWTFYEHSNGTTVVSSTITADPKSQILDFGNGHIAIKTELYTDTDDYCHFTNGTTRLDWKRLGIICQLERQMDTTYESYQYGDTLPLWHLNTGHEEGFASSDIEITFPIPEYHGQEMPLVSGLFQDASWNMYYDNYWASTNDYKNTWSTPTCRTPAPGYSNFVELNWSDDSTDIYLGEEQASNIVSTLCHELANSVTGELSHVYFEGEWRPGTGLALDYNADSVFCTVVYKHPSNTVEVSSSDGFHAGGWTYDDVDRHDWDFTNGTTRCDVRFDWGGYVPGGTYIYYRETDGMGESVYYEDNLHFGLKSGFITVPQVTLSAIGSGMITNWTWQVSGLPNVPTNLVSGLPSIDYWYVEKADGTIDTNIVCRWEIGAYAGGYGNGGYVLSSEFLGSGHSDVTWHLQSDDVWQGNTYMFQWEESRGIALSRSYTSPSITLTWNGYQYTTEEDLYLWGEELQGGSIPAFWDPEGTNATRYAYAAIVKHTSPTFTFATQETRDLTISRFSWPDNALDWSRIYSLRRSELELMLSARDVPGFASDMQAYSIWDQTFTWSAIDDIPHSDRMFRMIQGRTTRSQTDANNAQYDLLASLSGECKEKCAAIGGMPVGAIEHVGKVTQSERTAFLDDLKHAKVGATFEIYGTRYFVFEADVHYDGGVYEVDALYQPDFFPYLVGSCGWYCYVDYERSYSVTNRYRDARVDAHQAPVRKTVWKFKNLRDPNL